MKYWFWACAAIAACSPQEPGSVYMGGNGEGESEGESEAESEAEGERETPPPAPQVDRLPPTWEFETAPIRGQAQPGTRIEITGGANSGGDSVPASPADGRFCADVRLAIDVENTLEVRAATPGGLVSVPARVTIVQTGEPPPKNEPPPEEGPVNVALLAPYPAAGTLPNGLEIDNPDEGEWWDPADGSESTYARFSVGDAFSSSCDNYVWYAIGGFDTAQSVESIKVKWGDEYGQQYKVAVSDKDVPDLAVPSDASSDWTMVGQFGCGMANGDGGTDTFSLAEPVDVKWAALLMYENASFGATEGFRIVEFELWSPEAPEINDDPISPTCDNGM